MTMAIEEFVILDSQPANDSTAGHREKRTLLKYSWFDKNDIPYSSPVVLSRVHSMFALKNSVVFTVVASLAVQAAPSLNTRATTTALTTSQIDVYTPYTWYASTGYCDSSTTINWNCGGKSIYSNLVRISQLKPWHM